MILNIVGYSPFHLDNIKTRKNQTSSTCKTKATKWSWRFGYVFWNIFNQIRFILFRKKPPIDPFFLFHMLCHLSFYSQYVTSNFINPLSYWTRLTHNRWNCSNPRQRYVSLNNTGFKHWLEDRRPQKPLLTRNKARQDMAQHVMVEKSKPALYFNFLELNIQPDYILYQTF